MKKKSSVYKKILLVIIVSEFLGIFILYFYFHNSIIKSENFQKLKNKYNITIILNTVKNYLLNKPIIISNKNIKYVINKNKIYNPNRNKKIKKKDEREKIVKIGVAVDDRRIHQTLFFLTSLLENIGSETKYEIYVLLCLKIKVKLEQILNSLFEIYGENKLNIFYLNINDSDYTK